MTERTDISVLSTMAKKLSRDIQFATNVGRDSPFDPFVGRDITKLFSDKKEASSALMYFAQRPLRRAPAPVCMSRTTGRVNGAIATAVGSTVTDASYDPVALPEGPKVSFTKAKRELLSHLAKPEDDDDDKDPRGQASKSGRRAASASGVDRGLRGISTITEEDLMTCRQRAQLKAAQGRPSTRQSEKPGVTIVRADPRGARYVSVPRPRPGDVTAARASTPANTATPSSTMRHGGSHQKSLTSAQGFAFPWEKPPTGGDNKRGASAGTGRNSPNSVGPGGGNSPTSVSISTSKHASGVDLTHSEPLNSSAPNNNNASANTNKRDEDEDDEQWHLQRRTLLSRFGLLGGLAHHRRQHEPRGPKFEGAPSRNAPTGFLAPGKQLNDLSYDPKIDVTTKTRAVAHVELGKQASRGRRENTQLKYIESLLDYDHLSKLHRETREREKRSFSGVEASASGAGGPEGSRPGGRARSRSRLAAAPTDAASPEDLIFAKPLSAADELEYNWSSMRPASRPTHIPHTCDAMLFADRADEPIVSLLGGDSRPYRAAGKRAVSALR